VVRVSRSVSRREAGVFTAVERFLKVRLKDPRFRHVFRGEVKSPPPRAKGFHHRWQGKNPPGARVRRDANGNEIILARDPHTGVYRAPVDVRDPATGQWVPKQARSTFFPDHWTPQQVDKAISDAFRGRRPNGNGNGRGWTGFARDPTNPGHTIQIDGYAPIGGNRWETAYPVLP
jgi:hypothetical protein